MKSNRLKVIVFNGTFYPGSSGALGCPQTRHPGHQP